MHCRRQISAKRSLLWTLPGTISILSRKLSAAHRRFRAAQSSIGIETVRKRTII